MRCSYNIAGTETFRLSSSQDAFDSGMNLQNIPKGGGDTKDPDALILPNVRVLFVPDPGKEFFDADLDRADLQVVVWEADDADLKRALRLGLDMHCFNACGAFGIKGIPPEELSESHPNYKERRAQIGETKRQRAKAAVHAVDYGYKARTLAITLGISVVEAEKFIKGWFGAHPGIEAWHKRTEHSIQSRRFVTNAFGYRRYYFDRPDTILPEALAWQPQSTVACVINRIWERIFLATDGPLASVEVLLQVHDSLAGQYPAGSRDVSVAANKAAGQSVVIPYPDPLVIPVGVKTSPTSWGHCA
jgi:DNA polymerase-1